MNPANLGLIAVDNVYGRNGVPGANVSATCVSCHSALPVAGTSSHFVVHFSMRDGALRISTPANISARERTVAWNGSGALSKYGNFSVTPPTSDNTGGEVICESCHNIVRNTVGGNNLLETSQYSDPRPESGNTLTSPTTTLCEGCHVSGTMLGHHTLTGDVVTGTGLPLSTADTVFTRGYPGGTPSSEMGGTGSGVRYPAANRVSCLSCHGDGHLGFQGTGARILRRGYSRDPGNSGGAVTGTDNSGLDRQADAVGRLITNYTPLCDACHRSSD